MPPIRSVSVPAALLAGRLRATSLLVPTARGRPLRHDYAAGYRRIKEHACGTAPRSKPRLVRQVPPPTMITSSFILPSPERIWDISGRWEPLPRAHSLGIWKKIMPAPLDAQAGVNGKGGIRFYTGAPQENWFEHYLKHFDTVEINASFNSWPTH